MRADKPTCLGLILVDLLDLGLLALVISGLVLLLVVDLLLSLLGDDYAWTLAARITNEAVADAPSWIGYEMNSE
jgi:hypothetical protein